MVPANTEHGSSYASEDINCRSDQTAKQPLCKLAQAPQTPQIERNVNDVAMNKTSREQAPVVAAHR